MVVPNKPIGLPTKNDHFGVFFRGTTLEGNTHIWDPRRVSDSLRFCWFLKIS